MYFNYIIMLFILYIQVKNIYTTLNGDSFDEFRYVFISGLNFMGFFKFLHAY